MSTLFGLIAFASFVCGAVALFKPSLFNRFSKKPMTRKRSLGIFGSVFFITFILSAATSPTQPTTDNQIADESAQAESITYVTEEGTLDREVETNVIVILDDKTSAGDQRVRNIDAYDDTVLIEYNADDNLTVGLVRFGIWSDTLEIVQKLSSNVNINSVTVNAYIPLVDQYGNETPGKVMTVNLTKETWSKINWDNFNTDNLPNVADMYWIHPAINN